VTDLPIDAGFPAHSLLPERVLYRVHMTRNDPVHFASDRRGRFNLLDAPGAGTCYLAASPIGAYVETFGRFASGISQEDVEERSLSDLALTRPLNLADLTNRQVVGRYGIAGDISVGTDYVPSQRLASKLYEAGFDGVYYTARHDPAFLERSVAVFGSPEDAKIFAVSSNPIPPEVIAEGVIEFGLLVRLS
jgi:RES domain